MKEIYPNLFIGSEIDLNKIACNIDEWYIIHACKEPFHRKALGYTGRAAPKDHPEYLIAERDGRLILNLVDAPDPLYIPKEIIDKALNTINDKIINKKIFVHCNQGMSRSAVIGMLFLHSKGLLPDDFKEAERKYIEIYPAYDPNNGMRMYALNNW